MCDRKLYKNLLPVKKKCKNYKENIIKVIMEFHSMETATKMFYEKLKI